MRAYYIVLFVLAVLCLLADGKIRDGECEVCLKVMKDFAEMKKTDKVKGEAALEQMMKDKCKTYKKGTKERRLCYYIGADETSASGFLRDISKPLGFGLPADKMCERAKKKDAAVCELAFEQQVDLDEVDITKLRVKELKKILASWNEECKGCTSKSDFVQLINEKREEHAPSKKSKEDL